MLLPEPSVIMLLPEPSVIMTGQHGIGTADRPRDVRVVAAFLLLQLSHYAMAGVTTLGSRKACGSVCVVAAYW